jgi:hypothetical protein
MNRSRSFAVSIPAARSLQGSSNRADRSREIPKYKLRLQTDHAKPESMKLLVSPRVGAPSASVIPAIHFHDEPRARREEIHDEASRERRLPPELHAEAPSANGLPEPGFGARERRPIPARVRCQPELCAK